MDVQSVVGRVAELAWLDAALERLRSGRGSTLALAGEPGIGKTTMLSVLAARARAAGATVVTGRGDQDRPQSTDRRLPAACWDDLPALVAALAGPTVIVIDDVHRLRPGPVDTVDELVRLTSGSVLVAVSYRPNQLLPPLAVALSWAAASGTVQERRIGPLTPAEMRDLVGARPDLDRLIEESGGNPRYLIALADDGRERDTAIAGELGLLSPDHLAVAQAAAVLGTPFTPDLLTAVSPRDGGRTAAALDDLVALDIIRPTGPPLLEFRHPVVARVCYRRCEPSRRADLHARVDDELRRRGAPAAARAPHVAAVADRNRPDHVGVLTDAARDLIHSDPAAASEWLAVARTLLVENDPRSPRIQLLQAIATLLTGRYVEDRTALYELLPDDTDATPDEVARAAFHAGLAERLLGRYPEASAVVAGGLAAVAADPLNPATVSLHTELADLAIDVGDYPTAKRHAAVAAGTARRLGDRLGEAGGLGLGAVGRAYVGELPQAYGDVSTAARLLDGAVDDVVIANLPALYLVAMAESTLELLPDAERHLVRGTHLARRTGQAHVQPVLLKLLGETLYRLGHLDASLSTFDEAMRLAPRLDVASRWLVTEMRAHTVFWIGTAHEAAAIDAAERAAAECDKLDIGWARYVRCGVGDLLIQAGEADRGTRILWSAGGGPELRRVPPWRRTRWWEPLSKAAFRSGDRAAVARYADLGEQTVATLPSAIRRGFVHRMRMRARAADGDLRGAVAAATEAVECFDTRRLRLESCRTWLELAETGADDEPTAIDRAEELARACGSGRLLDAVEALRRKAVASDRPPFGLTVRELEVAEIASTGASSRVIANRLHLSVRTVDTHLGRAYRKLGVGTRAALANALYAARAGELT